MVRGVLLSMVSATFAVPLRNDIRHAPHRSVQAAMQTVASNDYGADKRGKHIDGSATFGSTVGRWRERHVHMVLWVEGWGVQWGNKNQHEVEIKLKLKPIVIKRTPIYRNWRVTELISLSGCWLGRDRKNSEAWRTYILFEQLISNSVRDQDAAKWHVSFIITQESEKIKAFLFYDVLIEGIKWNWSGRQERLHLRLCKISVCIQSSFQWDLI